MLSQAREMKPAGSDERYFRCYRKYDLPLSETQQGKHLDKCQLTLALGNGVRVETVANWICPASRE